MHDALLQAKLVTGIVINQKLSSFIQWPVLVFGLAYVLAFCFAFFLLARKVLRRWRGLWRRSQRRVLSLEVLGAGLALATWYMASRVVP
jgi:hypothetical protein